MVLTWALAMPAASRRSATCTAVKLAKAVKIRADSSARLALRLALLAKRAWLASSGCSKTLSQKIVHSRSFCKPSMTVLPSPAANGP